MSSLSLSLSTWPIPRGTEHAFGAIGNTQTCTAQGFFNQLLLGGPLYNLMLAIYYLLIGKYNLTEEEIARRYEKYMHVTAILTTLGFAIAGLPLTLYNNANLWCWIASYPEESESLSGENHDITCERGHGSWLYRWLFFYAPLWFIIAAITIIMIMLTISIRTEEKRFIEMQRQDRSISSVGNRRGIPTGSNASKDPRVEAFNLERSRKMFFQALFYVSAFYATWWAPTLNRFIPMITGKSYFFFMLATTIFAPLQGFLNFLVYRHGPCIA